MKQFDLRLRLIYTSLLAVVFAVYFLLNRNLTPKFDLSTYLDTLIPFSEPFAALYLSYLVYLWGAVIIAFFWFKTNRYLRFVLTFIAMQIIAYVLYILIPGKIIRPHPAGAGVFFDMVRVIYEYDMPSSLTPSLHVANSWLVALAMNDNRIIRFAVIPWAVLIVLSTLLIKQHNLVDVVSGLVLSTAIYLMFERYFPKEFHGAKDQ